MLDKARNYILPRRTLAIIQESSEGFADFTKLINENDNSLFHVDESSFRFRNWSYGFKSKLDRCAFRHTLVRAKVSAVMKEESKGKILFRIQSTGTFFVYFFLIASVFCNVFAFSQVYFKLGLLKCIGLFISFNGFLYFFVVVANLMFVERDINCFLFRLRTELSETEGIKIDYLKE